MRSRAEVTQVARFVEKPPLFKAGGTSQEKISCRAFGYAMDVHTRLSKGFI